MENIGLEFAVEVKNRFNGLQLADREPEELWNDIRDIVKETADKRVPKAKRKKVTKWLSDEAVKIADERREVRNKGDDKEYRRMNAAFQRRARQDKEQGITEKCRQIEESNKMGRTRDLYREIKEMTGSYSSRCGAEHGEGGNGREGGERNMAAKHRRTVGGIQTQRTPSTKTYMRMNLR